MYECPRCFYKTNTKCCYKNHLFREKICPPEKNDISLEDERNKITFKQVNYKCDKCNKTYASQSGYSIHKSECKVIQNKQPITQMQSTFIPQQESIPNKKEFTYEFGNIRKMGTEDITTLINETEFFEHCLNRSEEGLFDIIKMIWFDSIICNRNVKHMDTTKVTYLSVRGEITTKWDNYFRELFVTLDDILEQAIKCNKINKDSINSFVTKIGKPLGLNFYSDTINFEEDVERKKEIYEYIKTNLLKLK